MDHYVHHIREFDTETRHLSRLERAIYRDAIEMYYNNEAPLDGSDFDKLAWRLLCRDDNEVTALRFVLEEFFQLRACAWHHERLDLFLARRAPQ